MQKTRPTRPALPIHVFVLALLAGAAVLAPAATAQVDDALDVARVARLVEALGHEDYEAREEAARALVELGERALPALRAALEASRDPQATLGLERVLRIIDPPFDEFRPTLERALAVSQIDWDPMRVSLREGFATHPAATIRFLVEHLDDGTFVHGHTGESTIYTVCGNALTLLESLTDLRICGLGRPWIGFHTHDHRSAEPDAAKIGRPWRLWLEMREDVPVEEWFWGLSARELVRVRTVLRSSADTWGDAPARIANDLGRAAYPYLLDRLLDEQYACDGRRMCDQANALLTAMTGVDLGEIARHELLRFDSDHPMRRDGLAIARNRASMELFHERWSLRLAGGRGE